MVEWGAPQRKPTETEQKLVRRYFYFDGTQLGLIGRDTRAQQSKKDEKKRREMMVCIYMLIYL